MTYSGDQGDALAPDDIDDLARRARDGDRDALEMLLAAVRQRVQRLTESDVKKISTDRNVPEALRLGARKRVVASLK